MANTGARSATLILALEASLTGDSSMVAELFTDDVCARGPVLSVSSAVELAVEIEDRGEAFSDLELDVSPLEVVGDCAAAEWVVTATHSGPIALDDMLFAPTGARVILHGMSVAEFSGARIRAFRQYWDEVELLRQLTGDAPASEKGGHA